ncbi:AraC family transcriptional regulator [Nocardioides sp. CGMCC 1.13656]|nr:MULTISPECIES: helix-turn-helix domain-containing protein [unclassified Nocardioides]MBA2955467.1 AraC family transcriptional regulator [Nocardioides sp. CGMCC 1.13656]
MTQVFESTEIGASEDLLRDKYSAMRLRASGSRHLLRLEQDRIGRVRLDRTTFQMDLDLEADPLGALVVARVVDGHASYGRGAAQRRYCRGDVYVTADPDAGFIASLHDYQGEIAVLDPALLGQVAEPAPGSHGPIRLLDHEPVSAQATAMWRRTYRFALAGSRACADAGATRPFYAQAVARLLAAATLATFPTTALTEPTAADRAAADTRTLHRSTEFIEAHAIHDISLRDIADASGVTIRAVQLAFRRHLDLTPTMYLRKVRLRHVRGGLVAGSPEMTTVTAVASQWGFSNLGRFAAQYRAEFGELPAQTLRR